MPELTIAQKYEALLQYIKNKGVKIYHRSLDGDRDGEYDTVGCFINIQASLRGTVQGCFALAHEFGHWQQHRGGEFESFFTNEIYSRAALKLAYQAEQDASRRAKRLLFFYQITINPIELDPKCKKELMEFYRANYFVD